MGSVTASAHEIGVTVMNEYYIIENEIINGQTIFLIEGGLHNVKH